jgi:hypothetical protein
VTDLAAGSATMNGVTDASAATPRPAPASASATVSGSAPSAVPAGRDGSLVLTAVVVLVAGAALTLTARAGATPLLVAVALVQAALAPAWVLGTAMPGRWGGLVLAGLSAAGADVAVSVRPEGRLGVLLPVLGLALSAMFVHQLLRGAARVHVVSSLSAISLLVVAEVSLAALMQVRHEFSVGQGGGTDVGGRVAAAVAGAVAVGLLVSVLVDMVLPVPRFDPQVPRGVAALVAAAAVGAAVGALLLGDRAEFTGGRAVFLGGGLGALAGLLAVASGFVLHSTTAGSAAGDAPRSSTALRAALAGLLPLTVLMPVGFLLALAVRS